MPRITTTSNLCNRTRGPTVRGSRPMTEPIPSTRTSLLELIINRGKVYNVCELKL